MRSKDKICIIVATPLTVHAFLKDQIRALSRRFKVTIAANFLNNPGYKFRLENIKTADIPMVRPISPLYDLIAFYKLFLFLRKERFYAVHSITPKAGLLGMATAFFAGVKVRIHTFTGQVWVTRKGISRWLLKNTDRIIALFATHVYADSPSQREFLVANMIVPNHKIKVLADGSISGVDLNRFKPDVQVRGKIRNTFSIKDSLMILFLGRLTADKGILDLVKAFNMLKNTKTHLVMVGPDEGCLKNTLMEIAGSCSSRLHFVDYTSKPETFMAAADIFCLPSYREGFGSVVIEAAACGIPCVASRIYGLTDAVVNGRTGILVPPGDTGKLTMALEKFIDSPALRKKMGMEARARAKALFSHERLTRAMIDEYQSIIGP